jgi:hypothetical protein
MFNLGIFAKMMMRYRLSLIVLLAGMPQLYALTNECRNSILEYNRIIGIDQANPSNLRLHSASCRYYSLMPHDDKHKHRRLSIQANSLGLDSSRYDKDTAGSSFRDDPCVQYRARTKVSLDNLQQNAVVRQPTRPAAGDTAIPNPLLSENSSVTKTQVSFVAFRKENLVHETRLICERLSYKSKRRFFLSAAFTAAASASSLAMVTVFPPKAYGVSMQPAGSSNSLMPSKSRKAGGLVSKIRGIGNVMVRFSRGSRHGNDVRDTLIGLCVCDESKTFVLSLLSRMSCNET